MRGHLFTLLAVMLHAPTVSISRRLMPHIQMSTLAFCCSTLAAEVDTRSSTYRNCVQSSTHGRAGVNLVLHVASVDLVLQQMHPSNSGSQTRYCLPVI